MAEPPIPQWEIDYKMRVWEANYAARINLYSAHLTAIASFAAVAMNAIILANSASAGAVLAFLATMWGKPEAASVAGPALRSVTVFASGILAAMLAAGLSYLAQFCYSRADMNNEDQAREAVLSRAGVILHVLAVLSALGGIISFGIGALAGIEALSAANGGLTKS